MQACHTRHGMKSNLSFGSNLERPNNFGAGFEGLHCLFLFRHIRIVALLAGGTFGAAR